MLRMDTYTPYLISFTTQMHKAEKNQRATKTQRNVTIFTKCEREKSEYLREKTVNTTKHKN